MAEAYEIIHQVHDAYKGLADRLARLKGKSAELFRSHGREPKTLNPLASGNVSPVHHYIQYVREHEAALAGAGEMLNARVFSSLQAEFAEDSGECQTELHAGVLKESFDVLNQLINCDFTDCQNSRLSAIETDADELVEIAMRLKARCRVIKRQNEMKRNSNVSQFAA